MVRGGEGMIAATPEKIAEYFARRAEQVKPPHAPCKVCGATENKFDPHRRACAACLNKQRARREWMQRNRFKIIGG